MKESLISRFISNERFGSYNSIEEYNENLLFSKKAYIPLSILEISLKNSINNLLTMQISEEWYEDEAFLTKDSFHYEKVLNKDDYNSIFDEIYEILEYFNIELAEYTKSLNDE